jgi:hypothetical protein
MLGQILNYIRIRITSMPSLKSVKVTKNTNSLDYIILRALLINPYERKLLHALQFMEKGKALRSSLSLNHEVYDSTKERWLHCFARQSY